MTTWDDHYATPAGFRWWPNEELVRFVGSRQFDAVLEAGCGNGANLWFLAEHARIVHGVDGCGQAIAAARNYALQRGIESDALTLMQADIRNLPSHIRPGSLDLVVDCMTSQHLPWAGHEAVYREYFRVLRPGGQLWLYHMDAKTRTFGDPASADGFDFARLDLFPAAGLCCLPPPHVLARLLRTAGFATGYHGLAREYPDGSSVAHYTICAAKKVGGA